MDGKIKKQQRRIPDVRYAPPDRLGPGKESKNLPAKYECHSKYNTLSCLLSIFIIFVVYAARCDKIKLMFEKEISTGSTFIRLACICRILYWHMSDTVLSFRNLLTRNNIITNWCCFRGNRTPSRLNNRIIWKCLCTVNSVV